MVYVTDGAGNTGTSSPLNARRPHAGPAAPDNTKHDRADEPTPRSTTQAVLLRKGGAASSRLLGQLALSATPTKTTVDLRPLALGKGTFQFVVKVTDGKKSKTFTKTQTTKKGYSTTHQRQRLRRLHGLGHADRPQEVRQALGHLRRRRGEAEVTRER